jgi:hypothetical protein
LHLDLARRVPGAAIGFNAPTWPMPPLPFTGPRQRNPDAERHIATYLRDLGFTPEVIAYTMRTDSDQMLYLNRDTLRSLPLPDTVELDRCSGVIKVRAP